ncbi:MAG TPA: DUF502 domain-containing protein [Candidatus Baltobacteraceae bacterium]|jgi:uncharacterized membrane protein|nr:DUF502 domain-containing protein [Candidatus Baltobacteraceae bacterium]
MNEDSFFKRWRANFFAGLALVLPSVISVAVLVWLFRNVSNLTDLLLFFLPESLTHETLPGGQLGQIHWYWSLVALALAIVLVCLAGRYGRNYFGRKTIEWIDGAIMRVPLLNKIYGTVKQVNASFSSNKSSFKQVVLVTFPHPRSRAVGFVTGEQKGLGPEKLISVFIPTTPNPTSGFLVMVPENEIIKLEMSVADGIKFIISLGALMPDHSDQANDPLDRAQTHTVLK